MAGTAPRKRARRQKIARLVSTVRVIVFVSGDIRSRTISQRRTMVRMPRASSIAMTA